MDNMAKNHLIGSEKNMCEFIIRVKFNTPNRFSPRIHWHQRNRSAREEHSDEQEELASPNITQRAYQRCAQERQDAFDAHHQAIHQEGVIGKGLVEHIDDGHREEAPGEVLEKDDEKSMVDWRRSNTWTLFEQSREIACWFNYWTLMICL